MSTLHYSPILLVVVSSISLLSCVSTGVRAASSVADSYPVMIEDGENSFLILNDDEVANSQLLKHFSGASKEEVEEIVDSSPQMQEMILERIKSAVEKRKKNKSLKKVPKVVVEKPQIEAVKVVEVEQQQQQQQPQQQQIIHIVQDHSDGIAFVDEEDDEDDEMDEKKVAKMRLKLRTKAAKMFKIGAKMKEKLMKFVRKKDKKKHARKTQSHRFPRPHFHYKVTTVNE